jgi:hypothetical protein
MPAELGHRGGSFSAPGVAFGFRRFELRRNARADALWRYNVPVQELSLATAWRLRRDGGA